ncbi:MAG: DNA-binding response regulator [Phycisphaerales bacterium]|nr:MAG: DNA-binding response regulator [Phycisphaerales bacterium]
MQKKVIRVLCVDDHAFLVDGLEARFELEDDIECVGRLLNADGLIDHVGRTNPHIVLLDIEMPGTDPFEAIGELQCRHEAVRVIMLSAYSRDRYISDAFNAGAWGYFSKSDDGLKIINGIRKVASGQFALGPKVESRVQPIRSKKQGCSRKNLATPNGKLDSLTRREVEVLRHIGKGMTRADIAATLHRSAKTIDGHREAIMNKLDIHDRGELVRFAIREGLVEA